jgi:hypothetical protein
MGALAGFRFYDVPDGSDLGVDAIKSWIAERALHGEVTVIGRENVEKALDGRYRHLSAGFLLKDRQLVELTFTPRRAASGVNASEARRVCASRVPLPSRSATCGGSNT